MTTVSVLTTWLIRGINLTLALLTEHVRKLDNSRPRRGVERAVRRRVALLWGITWTSDLARGKTSTVTCSESYGGECLFVPTGAGMSISPTGRRRLGRSGWAVATRAAATAGRGP
jgi:hypothetical protein